MNNLLTLQNKNYQTMEERFAIDCNMDCPRTPEEWEAYYEMEKKAEELKKKGIAVDFV